MNPHPTCGASLREGADSQQTTLNGRLGIFLDDSLCLGVDITTHQGIRALPFLHDARLDRPKKAPKATTANSIHLSGGERA